MNEASTETGQRLERIIGVDGITTPAQVTEHDPRPYRLERVWPELEKRLMLRQQMNASRRG